MARYSGFFHIGRQDRAQATGWASPRRSRDRTRLRARFFRNRAENRPPAGASEPIHSTYTERYPPDTAVCIFWLKNRRPDLWRDVQSREHAVEMKLPPLSAEQRVARAQARLDEVFGEVAAKHSGASCGDKAEGA